MVTEATPAMRLFVAVDPSEAAVQDLAAAVRRLRTAPKRIRPELWHVTLAFLGEVAPAGLPTVEAAVAEAARKAVPGTLRIAGGGRFGQTVLWAGLRGDTGALRDLAEDLRANLGAAGFGLEGRPYRPHLTVARPSGRVAIGQLRGDVEALRRYRGPAWPLDQVHVVRSNLGQGGPLRYDKVGSWRLTGRPAATG